MPHCYLRHLVTEGEAIEAWFKGTQTEKPAFGNALSRQALVKTGKDITVIWVWKSENRVFVITAYETDMEASYGISTP
jgi:hypothetical protein